MATTYPIALKKFVRLYPIFAPMLTFITYGTEIFSLEAISFCVACVGIMHALYYFRIRDYFVVVVGDAALQLFSLTGDKEEIAYTDLLGPFERDFWIIKYYTFVSAKDPNKKLIVTNYIENTEACLKDIADHMFAASRS